MPFVNVKVVGPLETAQVARLQREVTALMAGILGKKAELTAVLVEPVAPLSWAVGAEPVAVAAHLAATVTAGTNAVGEKARFVAAAHALLRAVLGPDLPVATYVVIDEVSADAWGYAGQTQAQRADRRATAG